jgi:hypothetical protein
MSDYLRALKALGWLNLNTDYRVNNVSDDYPKHRESYGGLFSLSIFSNMESIGFRTGKELVEIAEREGWEDE